MTVLLYDAAADMRNREVEPPPAMINELVYADDTRGLAVRDKITELHMNAIGRAGDNYGLVLNWDRVEVMPVRCNAVVRKPDGSTVVSKTSMVYPGSIITACIEMAADIGRRQGATRADFVRL